MKWITLFLMLLTLATPCGCNSSDTAKTEKTDQTQAINSEAKILQSWHGDYQVAQLDQLPEKQRENPVGFIGNAKIFRGVWEAFKPGEEVPVLDFDANIVVFARNTQFYNRTRIGKVHVTDGVAEVLAMETMSAMPIEEKVGMSLAEVARQGITAVKAGDKNISIITE